MSKNLDETICLQPQKRVDTKGKRRETTWSSGWLKQQLLPGQLIGHIIWEKRVTGDPM